MKYDLSFLRHEDSFLGVRLNIQLGIGLLRLWPGFFYSYFLLIASMLGFA
jgi:hypothetical protein